MCSRLTNYCPPITGGDIEGFRSRFNLFAGPLLEDLDWRGLHLVAAGGSVLEALTMGDPTNISVQQNARRGTSDIDIFCIGEIVIPKHLLCHGRTYTRAPARISAPRPLSSL